MTSSPADLLRVMRETTQTAIAVEVRKLHAVLDWCVIHATDDEEQASFGDHGIPLAGDGTRADVDNVGRCDNTRSPVLVETIRQWCANPDATVIIKPVIDLGDHIHVAAYEIPDRLTAQDALVDHHCVFPWCTRPARSCDIDHAVPYAEGGTTCSCNLASC